MSKTKKILGLDLGTTSIGWALIEEGESIVDNKIIKLGVRVNPLTTDELKNFSEGKPITTTAARTDARGARRNLQRFKLRRNALIQLLKDNNWIDDSTPLTETGKFSTHDILRQRAKAVTEQVSLADLSRTLLHINKKRGYKSNRKANNEEEGGSLIDGMDVAKQLYDQQLTPGQLVHQLLEQGKSYVPSFYKSDLQIEFDQIWKKQSTYYPELLTDELYTKLQGQNKRSTQNRILAITGIYTAENKGKRDEKKKQHYIWRSQALDHKISKDALAYILVEINNSINSSSAYLAQIGDRSKSLYFNKQTVGQYLYQLIKTNPHTSLRNKVFYRQDYLDEFEKIWTYQSKFYPELTTTLKEEIRDIIIFYQRKLRSQKGLISYCPYESREITYTDQQTGKVKTRLIGPRVIPKSSPLFQEFKIWQTINALAFTKKTSNEHFELSLEDKSALFNELNIRGKLSQSEVLKFFKLKARDWDTNFPEGVHGNDTAKALYNCYQIISDDAGHGFDWNKKSGVEIRDELRTIFPHLGISAAILDFNASKKDLDQQESYQLWHLLYATEEDDRIRPTDIEIYGSHNVALKKSLIKRFGFSVKQARLLSTVNLPDDYGSLSAKAIRKILPYLKKGHVFSDACTLAKYNHSDSLTKEEKADKKLNDKLSLLRKNELRQPVVEKILNQMVHVVNQLIDNYGKPDEVRIELARDLKNSAKRREIITKNINAATRKNDDIKKLLKSEFGLANPTKGDVIKYKLWDELRPMGYQSLFTGQTIPHEKLFSKDIDVEHIIPRSLFFDDSFSNKTLAYRDVNLKKGNRTAIDFIMQDYHTELENYKNRIQFFIQANPKAKTKYTKLLMTQDQLGDESFTNRDQVQTQYIAKKAKEMLENVVPTVTSSIGPITARLRDEWGLINVMRELNLPKYRAVGLTEIQERKYGKTVEVITDWTKRNDHRHHAMDALSVAFTSPSHIQLLNNLKGAKLDQSTLYGLKNKLTETKKSKEGRSKRVFKSPMINFRAEAKTQLQNILISYKTKNKVLTSNLNRSKLKGKDNYHQKIQMTPRGQLHKETVYGQIKRPMDKAMKLNTRFDLERAATIVHPRIKAVVVHHLTKYQNNPKVAFSAKTYKSDPLIYQGLPLKEVICFETIYTIRKEVKEIDNVKKIAKIIDPAIRHKITERVAEYGGDIKKALSDLDANPLWLNEEHNICIKRVTIKGVNDVVSLHHKKDHFGQPIFDDDGNQLDVDFVSKGNNHHIAIYKDSDGQLHEQVVSFFEAVTRANEGQAIIDRSYNEHLGWAFLFTMKQNEMFVFPDEDFDPHEIDLLDPKNYSEISHYLFRVQKISKKDYFFRHHLETKVENNKAQLRNKTWRRIGLKNMVGAVKIRINHLGKIVHIGEY